MTSAYGQAGVRTTEELRDFPRLLDILRGTLSNRGEGRGKNVLDFGYYANVLDLGNNLGIAITTDGVGTKLIIAQQLGKYDTVGIDCVAMNVNDIICVGAEPVAMTDYIAVESAEGQLLSDVARGLAKGAELAHISIPGGEIAQVREMVHGLDLVGTCVGTVQVDKVLRGDRVEPGDAIVGFASSGIHSNGLTLAREVLLGEKTSRLGEHVAEFGRTLGEELLEPTTIYVDLALALLGKTDVRALAHITSDGFLNLARIEARVGFDIETLLPVPPVFDLIAQEGRITDEDMFLTYNMGVGFVAIVPESEAETAVKISEALGIGAMILGRCTDDPDQTVHVRPKNLHSLGGHFVRN
jgi:phosphoribosylformylglycinamidine cyclo-ligase